MNKLEILQNEKYNILKEIEELESKIDALSCKLIHNDASVKKLELIELTDAELEKIQIFYTYVDITYNFNNLTNKEKRENILEYLFYRVGERCRGFDVSSIREEYMKMSNEELVSQIMK